ncbi:hypothetical protein DMUE_3216 [Dictyocoela muelleri]|nr:hypothetical protein DMUE_3216 [Dictyocoela muelleri]
MTIDGLIQKILNCNALELIDLMMDLGAIPSEKICLSCNNFMNINKYNKNIDGYAWRCNNRRCISFKSYISLRVGIFFEKLRIDIKKIMRIILQYSSRQSRYSINESLYVSKPVVLSIINKLIHQIPANDFKR